MAYTKTDWVNNSVPAINQSNLNKIEGAIYNLHAVDSVIKGQLNDVNDLLQGVNSQIRNVNDLLDAADGDIDRAIEYLEILAEAIDWANETSSSANQKSASANSVIDNNRVLDIFNDLLSICKTKLCKQVNEEVPDEHGIVNYYVCKYDAGKFVMYYRDWEPE